MGTERGTTLLELLTVFAVVAVLGAIVVPGAARVRAIVSGGEGARRLALVLRAAQAQAQSVGAPVRVEVGAAGDYLITEASGAVLARGSLGTRVDSTYPGGALEFGARGWAGLPGASSPRAGHFSIAGSSKSVIVQLSGCVRCS
jgi:type II secretory pathway pseudopilin PulG